MQLYVNNKSKLLEHKQNARNNALYYLDWNKNANEVHIIFEEALKQSNNFVDEAIIKIAVQLDKKTSPSIIFRFKMVLVALVNSLKN